MQTTLAKDKKVILFDGVCNLCNSSILFVIKHDNKDNFRFAPLQGDFAKKVIKDAKVDIKNSDSIVLYSLDDGLHYKSTAALKIASKLNFPLNLAAVFLIIPKFLRDAIYDFIAKNRYKWFGKKDQCMIPTPELSAKFLD